MAPPAKANPTKTFALSGEEGERLLRILADSANIKRHFELFRWLQGDVQYFLPHQIMLSAWGDFPNWKLEIDVVSGLPGVRTEQLNQCRVDGYLKELFNRWVSAGRAPLALPASEVVRSLGTCSCAVHIALRQSSSLLVHGIRDQRGKHESLYVAAHSRSFTNGRPKDRCAYLVDLLIPQIDVAFRRVAAYRFAEDAASQKLPEWPEISPREHEILDWVCKGKTNEEIGAVLHISPYTVKNHVRRILKKLGAGNRTQAATKYAQALHESRRVLSNKSDSER